jgi:hypothetical protein
MSETAEEARVRELADALRTFFAGDAEFEKIVAKRFAFEDGDHWRGLAETIFDLQSVLP